MNYNKLSADPTALILGIISLVIVFLGCCCGLLVGLSLVLSIVGLVLAVKSLNEFDLNSENYSVQSRKNVYAAKIICIVGIVLSAIYIIIAVVFFALEGGDLSKKILEKYYEAKETQYKIDHTSATKKPIDTINKETDSIYSDSIKVE